jgi:hypothetical protein
MFRLTFVLASATGIMGKPAPEPRQHLEQAVPEEHEALPESALARLLLANAGQLSNRPAAVRSVRPTAPHMKTIIDVNPLKIEWGHQNPQLKIPGNVEEGSPPLPFEITDAQRQKFEEDGVLHIPGFLSNEWVEYLRGATDWQMENPHVWSLPGVLSGIYDYIQRGVWTSNDAFANFLYYSPLASALAGVAQAKELRLSTDLLMVNPNKGFAWHQDNMNGPMDAFKDQDSLRWWVTLDDCPPDHGAPVYLKGSHRNDKVSESAVYVDLKNDDLTKYNDLLEFRPRAGDLIVWHSRAIHKIDGPKTQDWDARKRRVYGGTVAVNDVNYIDKFDFSDMSPHTLEPGDPLKASAFPKIYPVSDPVERSLRAQGKCMKTTEGVWRVWSKAFGGLGEMGSYLKVLKPKEKKTEEKEGGRWRSHRLTHRPKGGEGEAFGGRSPLSLRSR